jgi:hypothetical protein
VPSPPSMEKNMVSPHGAGVNRDYCILPSAITLPRRYTI